MLSFVCFLNQEGCFAPFPVLWAQVQLHLLQVALENDSESPSALKSNMAAGEIRFFGVTNYLCFWVHLIKKISRLALQNLLSVRVNIPWANTFRLVQSKSKSYSYGLSIWQDRIFYNARNFQNFSTCFRCPNVIPWHSKTPRRLPKHPRSFLDA